MRALPYAFAPHILEGSPGPFWLKPECLPSCFSWLDRSLWLRAALRGVVGEAPAGTSPLEEALARRRTRAVARVYVCVQPVRRRRFIEVDAAVHDRARSMLKSLHFHDRYEVIVGRRFHHARHATLAVSPLLSPVATTSALRGHRDFGRAKHQGPPPSGHKARDEDGGTDPLVLPGPWVAAAFVADSCRSSTYIASCGVCS
jgi:hypothetical protein